MAVLIAPAPGDQLAAVFDALQRWYDDPVFRGCAILNAAAQHHVDAVRTITAATWTATLNS
ncbi:hypothetical protein AB0L05_22480 [Nonomuraea pusilla]|uniref:hypothetical protein n=1 Tax=Nonomuraea pusilla TaxID=46177 RepID=UPI0033207B56